MKEKDIFSGIDMKRKEIFEKTVSALNEKLTPYGFIKLKEIKNRGKNGDLYLYFEKNYGWKTDAIRLIYDKSYYCILPTIGSTLNTDFASGHIYDGTYLYSGNCVSDIIGKPNKRYLIPFLFSGIRSKMFINDLIKDILKSLEFFERSNTPQKCIAVIETEETMIRKKGASYNKAIEYLKNIQKKDI